MEGEDIPLIIECPFEVEIVTDSSNRPQMFGQGAWSKVYRGTKAVSPAFSPTDILTPPPSPQMSGPLLVAVKAPLSHASRTVLRNEAITLSRLSRTPDHEKFIIPFYGYLPSSASLVLAPVPMSLSDHVMARSRLARADHPDPNSADPVVGSTATWLSLAAKLITALAWLHNTARVVHGDIKPGNILLSPNGSSSDFAFDPVLIDFSSSHFLSSTMSMPNTLSALTREYTAPELLSPSVLRDPATTATTASDVFSLGVTLTVAATGELMVYHGSLWQRQHFATEGWNILEFARHGDAGTRLPRDGIVERVVETAVRKLDKGRIEAAQWTLLLTALQDESGNPTPLHSAPRPNDT